MIIMFAQIHVHQELLRIVLVAQHAVPKIMFVIAGVNVKIQRDTVAQVDRRDMVLLLQDVALLQKI